MMFSSRIFAVGDIHGCNKALEEVLDLVKFDFTNDTLVSLGDVVDRGPESFEVVETLLKCDSFISIKGNHDACWYHGYGVGNSGPLATQGGIETTNSYIRNLGENFKLPKSHDFFFNNQDLFRVFEEKGKKYLFVHGGFNRHKFIEHQQYDEDVFLWDRDLFMSAMSFEKIKNGSNQSSEMKFKNKDNFDLVFIGHTPTQYFGSSEPLKAANIWNLDTGCGKDPHSRLTIMNIETEEYWQSSPIGELYK